MLNTGERYLIDCAASQRAELVKRLGFYKLRAKVTVSPSEDEVAVAMERPSSPLTFADPRCAALGWRFAVPAGSLADNLDYEAARIALGLGDSALISGRANCFRTRPISTSWAASASRRAAMWARKSSRAWSIAARRAAAFFPSPSTAKGLPRGRRSVRAKLVGTLLSASGGTALALIRLDRLADATAPLLTDGVTVHVLKPRWASYDVPGSEGVA